MTASSRTSRRTLLIILFAAAAAALFAAMLYCGAVSIPPSEVTTIITGQDTSKEAWRTIVLESRLPMALTAAVAGAALSVAGLMLQTVFRNPLAGPSILGISTGASLGVAIVMLCAASFPAIQETAGTFGVIGGALAGAVAVLAILSLFSSMLRSPLSLLIVGIMVSYLASSVISLLNFFAPAESVRSFVVWGLGSYSGTDLRASVILAVAVTLPLAATVFYTKPLNAMLLGDRYLASMGYRVTRLRSAMLLLSGIITAVVTAYCGPIGFIGLIVPHVCRMAFGTSNHFTLIPACLVVGAAVSLLCALVCVLPSHSGVIPVNAITPIAGVPVIIYIMLNARRLKYFN